MDQLDLLQRRHDGEHHDAPHIKTANLFFAVAVILFLAYSVFEAFNDKIKTFPRVQKWITSPVLLWLAWLGLIVWGVLHHYSSNIVQIARRYGELSLAASTLTVLLAFKPALFPYTTYQVNVERIHKWIGRTSILFALIHGVIYTVSYITRPAEKSSSHDSSPHEHSGNANTTHESGHHEARHAGHHHKLFSTFNVFGMMALIAYLVIFSSSLGRFRRKAYYVFYALHRPLVILIYVLMIWHARPRSTVLVTLGLGIMAIQILIRGVMSKSVQITKIESFGPTLKRITFEPRVPQSLIRTSASHVRVSPPLLNPMSFFRAAHPYTLVGTNQLIVRESRFKFIEENSYSLFGPFPSSFNPKSYSHLLVFAGGSGVSLLPSLNNVIANQKFVWITRSRSETGVLAQYDLANCEVYLSSFTSKSQAHKAGAEDYELQEFEIESDSEGADNVDLEQNPFEVSDNVGHTNADDGNKPSSLPIHGGRPNFDEVADGFATVDEDGKVPTVCVVACGPEDLVNDVSSWANTRGYDTWTEVFAL